ncbi:MAG TPA: BON domain-containing protein [Gammaproteobacteria bacterium]
MNQRLAKTSLRSLLIAAGLCIGTAALAAPPPSAPSQPMPSAMGNSSSVTTDQDITKNVKSKLTSMSNLKDANINVSTMEGKVTLTGTVTSKDQENAAKAAAQSVMGVKKVDDDLSVSKGSSSGGH